MQRITYELALIRAVLEYLKTKPWNEVAAFIQALDTQGVLNQSDQPKSPETPA